jgi:hypothetical protein
MKSFGLSKMQNMGILGAVLLLFGFRVFRVFFGFFYKRPGFFYFNYL